MAIELSPHFSYEEMIRSQTAIRKGLRNTPNKLQVTALRALCLNVLEPARKLTGALHVDSGFRSLLVNWSVGGVSTSQHCKGEAADVVPVNCQIERAVSLIAYSEIPYDQLIYEGSWIHLSYSLRRAPRREILRAKFVKGKAHYVPYTPPPL